MQQTNRRIFAFLVSIALLLSAWTVVSTVVDAPEAHADAPGGSGGDTPHCSSITTTTPGTYDCHNHGASYYVVTKMVFKGCPISSGNLGGCGHRSYSFRSSTGACTGIYLKCSSRGPLKGDPAPSSVTVPRPSCPAGSHRRGNGCHSNHARPPCSESGYFRPHVGHSNWWVGRCPPPTTTTTSPPTTTTTPPVNTGCSTSKHNHAYSPNWCHGNHGGAPRCHATQRGSYRVHRADSTHETRYVEPCRRVTPPPVTTTTVRPVVTTPVSCGSSQHRHSSRLPCHSHPRPSCGWYTAISGSGHRERYAGSCAVTTTTTVRPVVTTPVSCGSSQHRHSSALPCHSHPRPSCGWYTAISGSGHRQRYAGSCVVTTPTTTPPPTTTAPPVVTTTTVYRPPPCPYGGTHPNCDPAPVISVTGSTVDEDSGRVNFTISLSKAVQGSNVYVNVVTSDGTANSGSDYTHVSRRVSIAANYLSASVSVPIIDDTLDEPNETFTLTLSNPSRATLSSTPYAQATIRDNDLPPFVGAVANLTAVCVNRELTLSWAPPTRGTVNDYRYGIYADPYLVSNRLASGTTTQTQATVPVTDTTVTYYAEVQARGGVNTNNSGWLSTGAIVCTVPPPPPVVSLNATNLSVGETSSVRISASLDTAPSGLASMRFILWGATNGNGSCPTGADFYVSDTEFTFTNTTSASITLYACDDDDTTDETVTLALTTIGISGLQLGSPTRVVVTITDDDTASNPILK